MKHILVVSIAAAALLFSSCADNTTTLNDQHLRTGMAQPNSNSESLQPVFNKNVGGPLDAETATRWKANFHTAYPEKEQTYKIPAEVIKTILGNTTCVGISLCYAVDESGNQHLLPVGVEEFTGTFIVPQEILVEGNAIPWKTACEWINRNTSEVKSFFFGSNMYEELLSSGTEAIIISYAVKDDNTPALILNGDGISPNDVGMDFGKMCPPGCPEN